MDEDERLAITPQNEPQQATIGYPGMLWQASDESNWIANYLKPALTSAGLSTQILGYARPLPGHRRRRRDDPQPSELGQGRRHVEPGA